MIDYDQLAQEYVQHRRVHPEILKAFVKTSQIKSQSKVLEIGCGTGNYITAVRKQTSAIAYGIDPSTQMLEHARKISPEITFELGRVENLQFSDAFFDFVFSVDVIHHIDDIIHYFEEIYRVLKPGGKLCTVTDSEEIIRTRRPLAFYFPETIEVDLHRYPSIFVLRKRMEQTRFRDIQHSIVEFAYPITNNQAYRDKAFSCLQLISQEAFQKGIKRMDNDLQKGPIQCISRYSLIWGTKKAQIVYV
ncbi:MAG: class I SAM-dependent methyltransferase [Candidatus Thorarchaeota archaeon]